MSLEVIKYLLQRLRFPMGNSVSELYGDIDFIPEEAWVLVDSGRRDSAYIPDFKFSDSITVTLFFRVTVDKHSKTIIPAFDIFSEDPRIHKVFLQYPHEKMESVYKEWLTGVADEWNETLEVPYRRDTYFFRGIYGDPIWRNNLQILAERTGAEFRQTKPTGIHLEYPDNTNFYFQYKNLPRLNFSIFPTDYSRFESSQDLRRKIALDATIAAKWELIERMTAKNPYLLTPL